MGPQVRENGKHEINTLGWEQRDRSCSHTHKQLPSERKTVFGVWARTLEGKTGPRTQLLCVPTVYLWARESHGRQESKHKGSSLVTVLEGVKMSGEDNCWREEWWGLTAQGSEGKSLDSKRSMMFVPTRASCVVSAGSHCSLTLSALEHQAFSKGCHERQYPCTSWFVRQLDTNWSH